MRRYGYIDGNRQGYPLSAWIWGHRLRIGQDWMEYLLEFLNVLAGFEYELGQGINDGVEQPSSKMEYIRFTRLGLRRFVFYHEHEKTRHPYDDHARQLMVTELRKRVDAVDPSISDPLVLLRSLLQAFSAVEAQRSWFAKSLFPAHHNLLFWEALRKGATKYRGNAVAANMLPAMLDEEVAFDPRNFFARGGEIYYLILSAGTEKHLDWRKYIGQRLQDILQNRNQALGQVAEIIDNTWNKLSQPNSSKYPPSVEKGRLGWIPDPDSSFYEVIAEDIYIFLHSDLDSLELLNLLAYLLGFHITLYIYHRASLKLATDNSNFCHPGLLIDAMEGADGGIIRGVSASLYSEQEALILQRGREYVSEQVANWSQQSKVDGFPQELLSNARFFFNITLLHKNSQSLYERKANDLLENFNKGEIDKPKFLELYSSALAELLLNDFRKNFLGIHRKLSKTIEFVAPRKGRNERFILGDNLLKAITFANLFPGKSQIYDEFLAHLYKRYGLVVEAEGAQQSGLYERHPINEQYFRQNKEALLEKMKHAGLAIEYSDATAMVIHNDKVEE